MRSLRACCSAGHPGRPDPGVPGAQHACGLGHAATASSARSRLPRRPGLRSRAERCWRSGSCDAPPKPTLAVWKFASCDGCQLTLLDCEDELLALAGGVEIAYFPEATRAAGRGPYDLSLVEGSVTTPHDAERIRQIRAQSRLLVTIGACATAGASRRCGTSPTSSEFISVVYARPTTSRRSRPRRRSRHTSRSTTSCAAARSTGASSSR